MDMNDASPSADAAPAAEGPGPKHRFRPEFVAQARELAQRGATAREVAEALGVPIGNIRAWMAKHAEFHHAMAVAKEPADERVIRSLYDRAVGYDYVEQQPFRIRIGPHQERIEIVEVRRHRPPDIRACLQWLKARCPDSWSRALGDPDHDRNAAIARITVDQVVARLRTFDDAR